MLSCRDGFKYLVEEDIYSMYYVYEHYKKDSDAIFYVGIGKIENGRYNRANSISKRNPHWHVVAKKIWLLFKNSF